MLAALLAQVPPPAPPLELPAIEYTAILPEIALIGAALLMLGWTSLGLRRLPSGTFALMTVAACAAALAGCAGTWADVVNDGPHDAIAGAIAVDGFTVFFNVVVASSVAVAVLLADGFLRREGLDGPEFHVLVLLSASGAMTMAAANDLIVVFLGLEILSIALYVLAGFQATRATSREAAMKYFVLGAFSSAIFLYGVALVYGATGSTNLAEMSSFLTGTAILENGVLLGGMALLLVGLGFKVAAVPFHVWTPDVYQGAPTPVTGFMAAVAKAGGFAALLRLLIAAFPTLRLDWQPIIAALAVLSLVVGSVLAVVQNDVKRLLAYSSIAHAGYVLIGAHAASDQGLAAALFYLLAYSFMVLGSFGVVTLVSRRGDEGHDVDDYRGLSTRRPGLALTFTVFLLAQAGVPFTSGFLAKFYVIAAAVEGRSYVLAVIAMVTAAVAAFVYLRVVIAMYTPPADEEAATRAVPIPALAGVALGVSLLLTIALGVMPDPVIDFARRATLL